MPEFTIDAFVDALTQLPEYGGYEALAGELSQQYPEATFSAMPESRGGGYDKGLYYQSMPTGTSAISSGPFAPFKPAATEFLYNANPAAHGPTYEALWPALTNVVNPQPTPVVSKMLEPLAIPMPVTPSVRQPELKPNVGIELGPERYQLEGGATPAGATAGEAKQLTEADFPKTPEGYKDFTDWLFKSGISTDEISRRATDFYKQVPRQIAKTMLGGGEVLEGGFSPPELLPTPSVTTPSVTTPVDPEGYLKPEPELELPAEEEKAEEKPTPPPEFVPVADEIPTLPVIDIDEITDVVDKTIPWEQPGDDLPPAPFPKAPPAFTLPPIEPPVGEEIPLPVTTSPAPPSAPAGTSRMADVIDITNNLTDDQKTEVGNIANQAVNYLKSVGWADSGEWGYARTRNMLTGGGQGPVVTQGPLVPWTPLGDPSGPALERDIARGTSDYISNVGGRDVFPSRLAPGERLGETTATSALDYVPEGKKEEYITDQVRQQSSGIGISGRSVMDLGFERVEPLVGALSNPDVAVIRLDQARNEIKNNISNDDLKDASTVDDVVQTIADKLGFGSDNKVMKTIKDSVKKITGLDTDASLDNASLITLLNKNIPFLSTDKWGTSLLDVIGLAVAGPAYLGSMFMQHFAPAIFKPITTFIQNLWKGGGGKVETDWEADYGESATATSESQYGEGSDDPKPSEEELLVWDMLSKKGPGGTDLWMTDEELMDKGFVVPIGGNNVAFYTNQGLISGHSLGADSTFNYEGKTYSSIGYNPSSGGAYRIMYDKDKGVGIAPLTGTGTGRVKWGYQIKDGEIFESQPE